MLGATLSGLASVVLVLVLPLSSSVAGQARDGSADSAADTVTNTPGVVAYLTLGLLLLALEVLLAASLSQALFDVY